MDAAAEPLKVLRSIYTDGRLVDKAKYCGFLGFNLTRIAAVAVVVEFRRHGIQSANVPVIYRDQKILAINDVFEAATRYAERRGDYKILPYDPVRHGRLNRVPNPMFWHLMFSRLRQHEHLEGDGICSVDRLDGHIWDSEEMAEYQYDYNNLL